MHHARSEEGGRGGLDPLPSSSQVQNLGLKLVLCEGIIALKTLKLSYALRRNQKLYEILGFLPFFAEKAE